MTDPALAAARELREAAAQYAITYQGEADGPSSPNYMQLCKERLRAACAAMMELIDNG
jgi:hypothetical protein